MELWRRKEEEEEEEGSRRSAEQKDVEDGLRGIAMCWEVMMRLIWPIGRVELRLL